MSRRVMGISGSLFSLFSLSLLISQSFAEMISFKVAISHSLADIFSQLSFLSCSIFLQYLSSSNCRFPYFSSFLSLFLSSISSSSKLLTTCCFNQLSSSFTLLYCCWPCWLTLYRCSSKLISFYSCMLACCNLLMVVMHSPFICFSLRTWAFNWSLSCLQQSAVWFCLPKNCKSTDFLPSETSLISLSSQRQDSALAYLLSLCCPRCQLEVGVTNYCNYPIAVLFLASCTFSTLSTFWMVCLG